MVFTAKNLRFKLQTRICMSRKITLGEKLGPEAKKKDNLMSPFLSIYASQEAVIFRVRSPRFIFELHLKKDSRTPEKHY